MDSRRKRTIGIVGIVIGSVILVFFLFSYDPHRLGPSYSDDARVGLALGTALLVGGILALKTSSRMP